MAIQKRFIHFKKFSDFNSKKLSANEANTQYTVGVSGEIQNGEPDILYQSYIWIKDTQQQWTHGRLYNGIDTPIVKGEAENSAVLKGGDNQAISENSVALGKDNIAGLKGFYYKNVKPSTSNPKLFVIYVSKIQTIPQLNATDFTVESDIDLTQYYEVGDILTIINDTKYENCCILRSFLSVNGKGTIQIELITDRNPFNDGIANMTEEDIDIEDFSIYCVNKPLNGISVLSHSCFVGGHDNMALSTGSFACGKNNNVFGKYSFAVGRDNEAAYSAYAEGRNNKALRDNAHVEGRNTIASAIEAHAEGRNTTANGAQSHAEGLYTIADGQASHAEGDHTIVTNRAEHAQGKFNASNTDTIHSVGIGTSDNTRKNAHEIMQNGKHYVYGIGGYDGTNPDNAIDVATYLPNMLNITYSELKDLRDNSQLVPGQQYRITDYVTTTIQENTLSAGHQFDIIVTADDVNVLNEVARAIQHEGDTYFSDSDLNAWQIWYCLDNDKERFNWADDKIRAHVKYDDGSFDELIVVPNPEDSSIDNEKVLYIHDKEDETQLYITEKWNIWDESNRTVGTCLTISSGKGVIYRMIDEWNNDCPYDFKNIQFNRGVYDGGGIAPDGEEEDMIFYLFTFSFRTENNEIIDTSIFGNNGRLLNDEAQISGVYGNVIGQYMDYDGSIENPTKPTQRLNDIVFYSHYDYEGGTYYGCYSNSFGDCCYNNSFGNSCYDNSFGNFFFGNSFGSACSNNSFGNLCSNNSFGDYCNNNSFGNTCYGNSFGDYCRYNRMEDGVNSVELDNNQAAAYNQQVQNYHFTRENFK